MRHAGRSTGRLGHRAEPPCVGRDMRGQRALTSPQPRLHHKDHGSVRSATIIPDNPLATENFEEAQFLFR